jgi:hypothetical protein
MFKAAEGLPTTGDPPALGLGGRIKTYHRKKKKQYLCDELLLGHFLTRQ